ncbi:hypothetical protein [Blastococcus sp. URHD0036]|uniref:hypothetical protein n=1 Tax=Blastococcus sp. URHD0036 TaxID=1380356 RepID=UPI0004963759|nr:hypothetical protein [Blastococcus sp. URHD0036]
MTALVAVALIWPVVVVLVGLRIGQVLRAADDGTGWLSGRTATGSAPARTRSVPPQASPSAERTVIESLEAPVGA